MYPRLSPHPLQQLQHCGPFLQPVQQTALALFIILCLQQVKRGIDTNYISTICLTRHMTIMHLVVIKYKGSKQACPAVFTAATATAPSRHSFSQSASSSSIHHALSAASSDRDNIKALGAKSIPPSADDRKQISLPQLLKRRKKYTPCHTRAQRLNTSLAKLLSLQLLPYNLVNSASFREIATCVIP